MQKKFAQERREQWRQRQEERGISVYQCPKCGRYEREGDFHNCFRAQQRGPVQRRTGVPFQQQWVVTNTASGVNFRPQPVADLERLKKEKVALEKAIESLEQPSRMQQFTEAWPDSPSEMYMGNDNEVMDQTNGMPLGVVVSTPSGGHQIQRGISSF